MGFGRTMENQFGTSAGSLNALTGIDGIWTQRDHGVDRLAQLVLMPLRALMGFGLELDDLTPGPDGQVLMPLRALMGFGLSRML